MGAIVDPDNTIYIPQGDTLDLPFRMEIRNEAGRYIPFFPSEGDQLWFSLKRSAKDKDPFLKVDIPVDTMQLRVEAEEMEKIPARRDPYRYAVRIRHAVNGNVDTVIRWKPFFVTEEGD